MSKQIVRALLAALVALLFPLPLVHATCHCHDVCECYGVDADCESGYLNCWAVDPKCPNEDSAPSFCTIGGWCHVLDASGKYIGSYLDECVSCWNSRYPSSTLCTPRNNYVLKNPNKTCSSFMGNCRGYCVCNVAGCNCGGCGDCNYLFSPYPQGDDRQLHEERGQQRHVQDSSCEDYYYYSNLTMEEKISHFQERHCGRVGMNATRAVVEAVEDLVDANRDGNMSCDEFNNAYHPIDFVGLCDDDPSTPVVKTTTVENATTGPTPSTTSASINKLTQTTLLGIMIVSVSVMWFQERI